MNKLRYIIYLSLLSLAVLAIHGCSDDDTAEVKNLEPFKPGESTNGYPKFDFGSLDPIEGVLLSIESGTATYRGSFTLPAGKDPLKYYQPGSEPAKAFDGNLSANQIYHSPWGSGDFPNAQCFPVDLEFTLKGEPEYLDYINLVGRPDGGNGLMQEINLWIKSEGGDYVNYGHYQSSTGLIYLDLRGKVTHPRKIKVEVLKGSGNYVSLAEIQCYQESRPYEEYMKYFTTSLCTELKPEYDRAALENISNGFFKNLALAIYDKKYDVEHRTFDVQTYPRPEIRAEQNQTSIYGILDNATGVYVEWNDNVVIFVDEKVADMTVRLVNPMKGFAAIQEVPLNRGVNVFTAKEKGLIYLIYQSDIKPAVTTKVHIASGTVNGVYDIRKHKAEDWTTILNKATFTHLDILGKHAHLVFTTSDLRAYTTDGMKLANAFDTIVYLEEEFQGNVKYDRMNETRLCIMALKTDGHMFATAYYTGYNLNTMPELCDIDKLLTSGIWGPAHELGHVNQTRPGLKWGQYGVDGDMTEVTNNIYSMYIQTYFGNRSRLMEQDDYNTAHNLFFVTKQLYDKGEKYDNVFARLVPMWQLQLYFSGILGMTDFYKELHEAVRTDPWYKDYQNYSTNVRPCMNRFAYWISRQSGYNMVGFLNKYGFGLKTTEIPGYAEIANLPEPPHAMEYIDDENTALFKEGAAEVTGGTVIMQVQLPDVTVTVKEDCQNAVAYEVHDKTTDALLYVTSKKKFAFMSNSSNFIIKAVGAKGQRIELKQTVEK